MLAGRWNFPHSPANRGKLWGLLSKSVCWAMLSERVGGSLHPARTNRAELGSSTTAPSKYPGRLLYSPWFYAVVAFGTMLFMTLGLVRRKRAFGWFAGTAGRKHQTF